MYCAIIVHLLTVSIDGMVKFIHQEARQQELRNNKRCLTPTYDSHVVLVGSVTNYRTICIFERNFK